MAYTPQLSQTGSATLRRLAWFWGKPMTRSLEMLIDSAAHQIVRKTDGHVCGKCRDNSICTECPFNAHRKAVKCSNRKK